MKPYVTVTPSTLPQPSLHMPCCMPLLMPFYPSWEKCTPELLPTPSLSGGVMADKLITLAGSICEMEKELHLLHRPHSNRSVNLGYYFLPPVQVLPTRWFSSTPTAQKLPSPKFFSTPFIYLLTVFHVPNPQFWCSMGFLQPPYFTLELFFFSICSCLLVILLFLCGDKQQDLAILLISLSFVCCTLLC